jgi:type IV pilus assembly protein PilV
MRVHQRKHAETRPPARRQMTGAGLLEVLVAVLVLGIGLLGVAATQSVALKSNQVSAMRSQAIIESYGMLDAIRAAMPPEALTSSSARAKFLAAYQLQRTCNASAGAAAAGTLAGTDLREWVSALRNDLGEGACGTVACNPQSGECAITVEWDESRLPGGQSGNTLTIKSRP